MSAPVGIRFGASTEIGLVREVNEDSKLHRPPVFAVADGMGGHLAGDVASAIAVETLSRKVVEDSEALAQAVREANAAIYEKASTETKLQGMGTTITAMYAGDHSAQIVHVGDSRAYLLRSGELSRLTNDHTVVGRLVLEGRIKAEEADRHPQRNYLERALGIEPSVELDVEVFDTRPGDRILLCSDGLFGMIDDDQIKQVLVFEADPQKAATRLCREAVEAGGRDNVTAIVVDYPGGSDNTPAKPKRNAAPSPSPAASPGPKDAASRAGPRPKRSKKKLVIAGVLTVAVILAAGVAAWAAIKGAWYVGADGGNVAVFNGVPGAVAGIELSRVDLRTKLKMSQLPEVYRVRVNEGIKATSRKDATSIITNLQKLAEPQPPPPAPPPAGPAQ